MIVVAAMVYAIVLAAASFEHHDLICHLKHPDHCTACSSNVLGSDPRTPAVYDAQLTDAGRAVAVEILSDSILLAVRSTGRSPPAIL
jgi:hypothetical protein